MFYVVEGRYTFIRGADEIEAGPGQVSSCREGPATTSVRWKRHRER